MSDRLKQLAAECCRELIGTLDNAQIPQGWADTVERHMRMAMQECLPFMDHKAGCQGRFINGTICKCGLKNLRWEIRK